MTFNPIRNFQGSWAQRRFHHLPYLSRGFPIDHQQSVRRRRRLQVLKIDWLINYVCRSINYSFPATGSTLARRRMLEEECFMLNKGEFPFKNTCICALKSFVFYKKTSNSSRKLPLSQFIFLFHVNNKSLFELFEKLVGNGKSMNVLEAEWYHTLFMIANLNALKLDWK